MQLLGKNLQNIKVFFYILLICPSIRSFIFLKKIHENGYFLTIIPNIMYYNYIKNLKFA